MTIHNKKILADTLLRNSKITGVQLRQKSHSLTSQGHGLYIKSDKNDQYIDLRDLQHKPYWGHTHPLTIQKELGFLDQDEKIKYATWGSVTSESIKSMYNKDNIIKLDEKFLTLSKESQKNELSEIAKRSSHENILIWEKDLILGGEQVFLTHQIQSPKVLEITQLKVLLLHDIALQDTSLSKFEHSLICFNDNILFSKSGKIQKNILFIDNFLKKNHLNSSVKRVGHYLLIQKKALSLDEFIDQGIFIHESQLQENSIRLCFPTTCTKDELLDSLERLKNILT